MRVVRLGSQCRFLTRYRHTHWSASMSSVARTQPLTVPLCRASLCPDGAPLADMAPGGGTFTDSRTGARRDAVARCTVRPTAHRGGTHPASPAGRCGAEAAESGPRADPSRYRLRYPDRNVSQSGTAADREEAEREPRASQRGVLPSLRATGRRGGGGPPGTGRRFRSRPRGHPRAERRRTLSRT